MKQVSILITATADSNYNVLIAAGTSSEKFFEGTDGIAGLKGRLTAIGDSLNQYLPQETPKTEAPDGALAAPVSLAEGAKVEEKKPFVLPVPHPANVIPPTGPKVAPSPGVAPGQKP